MDAAIAGLIGTIVGASINSIGASVSASIMSRRAISSERIANLNKMRNELYPMISSYLMSLKEFPHGRIDILVPDPTEIHPRLGEIILWSSESVLSSLRVYHFLLESNNYLRLREATPELSDVLVARILESGTGLGQSENFKRYYGWLCNEITACYKPGPDVWMMNNLTRSWGHHVVEKMRLELKSR
jgi:hypothetical protein